jgi:hypothetical protein
MVTRYSEGVLISKRDKGRGAQTTCFLYGAPKIHDHYGLS